VIIRALRFSPDGHSPPGATFSDRRLHFEQALKDATGDFVVSERNEMTHRGLTAQFEKILYHAGVPRYPKLFQNLRSTRETELTNEGWSIHQVTAWIGNSPRVALKHYLQVTDDDYRKAASQGKSESVSA
jgi:hypothetical protein